MNQNERGILRPPLPGSLFTITHPHLACACAYVRPCDGERSQPSLLQSYSWGSQVLPWTIPNGQGRGRAGKPSHKELHRQFQLPEPSSTLYTDADFPAPTLIPWIRQPQVTLYLEVTITVLTYYYYHNLLLWGWFVWNGYFCRSQIGKYDQVHVIRLTVTQGI